MRAEVVGEGGEKFEGDLHAAIVGVSGAGSLWENRGRITVGLFGTGTLRIENGASVTSTINIGAYGGGASELAADYGSAVQQVVVDVSYVYVGGTKDKEKGDGRRNRIPDQGCKKGI